MKEALILEKIFLEYFVWCALLAAQSAANEVRSKQALTLGVT